MSSYTQQCRACHIYIEGTGGDVCYSCLARHHATLQASVRELQGECERLKEDNREQSVMLEEYARKGANEILDAIGMPQRIADLQREVERLNKRIVDWLSDLEAIEHGEPVKGDPMTTVNLIIKSMARHVEQSALTPKVTPVCAHGQGLTDYCQPCGRIHGQVTP